MQNHYETVIIFSPVLGEDDLKKAVKKYKKILCKVTRDAYNNFWKNQVLEAGMNSKKIWDIVNKLLNRKDTKRGGTTFQKGSDPLGNPIYTNNPREISNLFNDFFSSVGPNLAKKIKCNKNEFKGYLPTIPDECPMFTFQPVTQGEIVEIAKSMSKKMSSGPDNFPSYIVKLTASNRPDIYTAIVNDSLEKGHVHERFKATQVVPIYKSGDDTSVNNYRLISLINTVSNVAVSLLSTYLSVYFIRISYALFLRPRLSNLQPTTSPTYVYGLKPFPILAR